MPSANTIIIERADQFGLAQLHQLRGRVGRSHHQRLRLPADADRASRSPRMRKSAWRRSPRMEDLGAGFMLATHDLEIRGAGELLGEDQSGQIGRWASRCTPKCSSARCKSIRKGEQPNLDQPLEARGPEVNLRVPALIPGATTCRTCTPA